MTGIGERAELLRRIEDVRSSRALLYVTGDRRGLETQIGQDVIDLFVDHLDAMGPVTKISLLLHTSGGNTSAAWNLVNLLQMFCEDLELIAPGKCMSAGTLVSLGADRIVMTKQATLGPIDPTIQHPLGPSIPGANPDARAGVSVEAVKGYLQAIRALEGGKALEGQALLDLSTKVHPLVLGQIFRSQQQIRDLAERLLKRHTTDSSKNAQIIDFLCSDSGSHDYTINRREAAQLGLNVEKCSEELYAILKPLCANYSSAMELQEPWDIGAFAARGLSMDYCFTRALIESADFGAHHHVSEGRIEVTELVSQSEPGGMAVKHTTAQDRRTFEGWRRIEDE